MEINYKIARNIAVAVEKQYYYFVVQGLIFKFNTTLDL